MAIKSISEHEILTCAHTSNVRIVWDSETHIWCFTSVPDRPFRLKFERPKAGELFVIVCCNACHLL